jgi:large subunit ribosomal protein L10e
MGGIPNPRITQFVNGNKQDSFPVKLSLISEEQCQARHGALESARITSNRYMEKKAGLTNYRLRVLVYPHVILRENKQATGAGADRVSQGMRQSYGKVVSTAACINRNQPVMSIETHPQFIKLAKSALRKAGMKLPSPCHVVISE